MHFFKNQMFAMQHNYVSLLMTALVITMETGENHFPHKFGNNLINKLNINWSYLFILGPLVMIYFQLYWHYWFVKLTGGYIINTLLPIMVLFLGFLIRELMHRHSSLSIKKRVLYLLIPLSCYVLFASISIILNEEGFNNIKSYLIYIYSPVLLFISMLGLFMYKDNKNVSSTINLLFIFAIIFSGYVAFTFLFNPTSIAEMPALETKRGIISADTGSIYGIESLIVNRYTIPGISSNTYGALLVPIVLGGFYIQKKFKGNKKYLFNLFLLFLIFSVFMSVSRGAIISLIAGTLYLAKWRWFKMKEIIILGLFLIISIFTFAKPIFLRSLITLATFIPINKILVIDIGQEYIGNDPHLLSITETISYIYRNPFLGMGLSNLAAIQEFSYGKEHNNYLSIAASFGLLTASFYILFIIVLLTMLHKTIKRLPKESPMKEMGIVLCAGLIALIVYMNSAPAEFHFIWIWFGLAAVWMRNCTDEILHRRPV